MKKLILLLPLCLCLSLSLWLCLSSWSGRWRRSVCTRWTMLKWTVWWNAGRQTSVPTPSWASSRAEPSSNGERHTDCVCVRERDMNRCFIVVAVVEAGQSSSWGGGGSGLTLLTFLRHVWLIWASVLHPVISICNDSEISWAHGLFILHPRTNHSEASSVTDPILQPSRFDF